MFNTEKQPLTDRAQSPSPDKRDKRKKTKEADLQSGSTEATDKIKKSSSKTTVITSPRDGVVSPKKDRDPSPENSSEHLPSTAPTAESEGKKDKKRKSEKKSEKKKKVGTIDPSMVTSKSSPGNLDQTSELEAKIPQLETDKQAKEAFLVTLKEQITGLETQLAGIDAEIKPLESKIKELEEQVSQGTLKIPTLRRKQDDLQKKADRNFTKGVATAAATAVVGMKEDQVDGLTTQVQELREELESLTAQKSKLDGELSVLRRDKVTLGSQVETLKKDVTTQTAQSTPPQVLEELITLRREKDELAEQVTALKKSTPNHGTPGQDQEELAALRKDKTDLAAQVTELTGKLAQAAEPKNPANGNEPDTKGKSPKSSTSLSTIFFNFVEKSAYVLAGFVATNFLVSFLPKQFAETAKFVSNPVAQAASAFVLPVVFNCVNSHMPKYARAATTAIALIGSVSSIVSSKDNAIETFLKNAPILGATAAAIAI